MIFHILFGNFITRPTFLCCSAGSVVDCGRVGGVAAQKQLGDCDVVAASDMGRSSMNLLSL